MIQSLTHSSRSVFWFHSADFRLSASTETSLRHSVVKGSHLTPNPQKNPFPHRYVCRFESVKRDHIQILFGM
jgi:hypothetical protein